MEFGEEAASTLALGPASSNARAAVISHERARTDARQRFVEITVDVEIAGVIARALHAPQRGAGIERRAHRAFVLIRHFAEVDLGSEAAILVDRVHVVQHRSRHFG